MERVTATQVSISPELNIWIQQNKAKIRSKVHVLKDHHGPTTKEQVLKQIIRDPMFLHDVWFEIVKAMSDLEAPHALKAEAKHIADAMTLGGHHDEIPKSDQQALEMLAHELDTAKSNEQAKALVKQTMIKGELSETIGRKLIEYIEGNQQAVAPNPLARLSSWGACGFCGFLGLIGGPFTGLVSCVVCALSV